MSVKLADAYYNYIQAIFEDGDWLNDWLTHMPDFIQPLAIWTGRLLNLLAGG